MTTGVVELEPRAASARKVCYLHNRLPAHGVRAADGREASRTPRPRGRHTPQCRLAETSGLLRPRGREVMAGATPTRRALSGACAGLCMVAHSRALAACSLFANSIVIINKFRTIPNNKVNGVEKGRSCIKLRRERFYSPKGLSSRASSCNSLKGRSL